MSCEPNKAMNKYTMVRTSLFDMGLAPGELLSILALMMFADNTTNTASVLQATLSNILPIGKRTLIKSIKGLEEKGLVTKIPNGNRLTYKINTEFTTYSA